MVLHLAAIITSCVGITSCGVTDARGGQFCHTCIFDFISILYNITIFWHSIFSFDKFETIKNMEGDLIDLLLLYQQWLNVPRSSDNLVGM